MTAWRALSRRGIVLGMWLGTACSPRIDPSTETVTAITGAIVSGTADTQDPAVVGIGSRRIECDALLSVHCTGTLIAPWLVLTAAHCVDGAHTASNLEVLFGSNVKDPAAIFRRVTQVEVHPDYLTAGDAADLALLILSERAPVAPVVLNPSALDGNWVGQNVRLVGFGQTRASGDPPGEKRSGTSLVSEIQSTQFRTVPGPSLSCHGDSGGPLFNIGSSSELLIGITNKGDPGCATYGLNVRVDTALHDFIMPWIQRTTSTGPPRADGALPDAQLCTATCVSDADCPAGLSCQVGPTDEGLAARCVVPGLLAGALSSVCTSQTQCAERCVRVLPDPRPAACRCYSACATELPPPTEGTGCRFGRSVSTGPGLQTLLLALLLLATQRRRNTACLR